MWDSVRLEEVEGWEIDVVLAEAREEEAKFLSTCIFLPRYCSVWDGRFLSSSKLKLSADI